MEKINIEFRAHSQLFRAAEEMRLLPSFAFFPLLLFPLTCSASPHNLHQNQKRAAQVYLINQAYRNNVLSGSIHVIFFHPSPPPFWFFAESCRSKILPLPKSFRWSGQPETRGATRKPSMLPGNRAPTAADLSCGRSPETRPARPSSSSDTRSRA